MKKLILLLGVGGVLFSGYLSAVKFFSKTCALGESCPYFWGYPACYYGFAMYVIITATAAAWVLGKMKQSLALHVLVDVSFLGILFAGYYTVQELPLLFEQGFSAYVLGLPTCALGLIFYVTIFVLSLVARFRMSNAQ